MIEDLSQYSFATQLLLVFAAGIATSLTPCVYPLIPITLSLFGADESCKRSRAFLLSSTFVCGIAVTFTSLGIISALTGQLFGSILSHPAVVILLVSLLIGLACTSLDLFQIPLLCTLQSKASTVGTKGYLGAFFAGTATGVVASPCVGPALVAILIFVAQSGDLFSGTLLLLSFSLGMGLLFIALGTFSGMMNKIPRSGHWMSAVKYLMSLALFSFSLFLLQPLVSFELLADLLSDRLLVTVLVTALCLVFALYGYRKNLPFFRFASAAVLSTVLFGTFLAKPSSQELSVDPSEKNEQAMQKKSLLWHSTFSAALEQAKRKEKDIFIDLYADWCVACKELDKTTFVDSGVKKALSRYVLAKIDFTNSNEETEMLTNEYGIVGLPWLFFTDSRGKLISGSTITGYVTAEEFLERIKTIEQSNNDETQLIRTSDSH